MGKRRHGKPDTFQTGGFVIDERPASDEAARVAATRFVETFVMKTRRERALTGLLHPDPHRRTDVVQRAYEWIDRAFQTELEGNTGFPQHLHERFGDLRGVMLDNYGARHITLVGAAIRVSGKFGAIFVADASPLAMLFPEIGPPSLCVKK